MPLSKKQSLSMHWENEVQPRSAWIQWVLSILIALLLGVSLAICRVAHLLEPIRQKQDLELSRFPWHMQISIVMAPNLWFGTLTLAVGGIYIFRRQDRAVALLPWLLGWSFVHVVLCTVTVYFMMESLVQTSISR